MNLFRVWPQVCDNDDDLCISHEDEFFEPVWLRGSGWYMRLDEDDLGMDGFEAYFECPVWVIETCSAQALGKLQECFDNVTRMTLDTKHILKELVAAGVPHKTCQYIMSYSHDEW